MRRHRCAAAILWLAGLAGATASAAARDDGMSRPPASRLRFSNARIAEVFRVASERSPSFRTLVAAIEESPSVLVYLADGRCGTQEFRSCLHIVSTVAGRRYLWVDVSARRHMPDVIAQLAHELHHALEIAGHPDVVDATTLQELYREIGFESCRHSQGQCWETNGAKATERLVVSEVAQSGRGLFVSSARTAAAPPASAR